MDLLDRLAHLVTTHPLASLIGALVLGLIAPARLRRFVQRTVVIAFVDIKWTVLVAFSLVLGSTCSRSGSCVSSSTSLASTSSPPRPVRTHDSSPCRSTARQDRCRECPLHPSSGRREAQTTSGSGMTKKQVTRRTSRAPAPSGSNTYERMKAADKALEQARTKMNRREDVVLRADPKWRQSKAACDAAKAARDAAHAAWAAAEEALSSHKSVVVGRDVTYQQLRKQYDEAFAAQRAAVEAQYGHWVTPDED